VCGEISVPACALGVFSIGGFGEFFADTTMTSVMLHRVLNCTVLIVCCGMALGM